MNENYDDDHEDLDYDDLNDGMIEEIFEEKADEMKWLGVERPSVWLHRQETRDGTVFFGWTVFGDIRGERAIYISDKSDWSDVMTELKRVVELCRLPPPPCPKEIEDIVLAL